MSFRRGAFKGTAIDVPSASTPGSETTQFNTCLDTGDPKPDGDFYPYALAVHEAGHALGLSGFGLPVWNQDYEASHSTIPESVMNYDDKLSDIADWLPMDYKEPDCFPHPFDVMAVYTLYRSK